MRRLLLIAAALTLLAGCARLRAPAKNPDPNHTHADFAVWIGGQELDFSGSEFMSGSSKDERGDEHDHEHKPPSLHLHDGNGHLIHRHKPGLSFGDFLTSLGMAFGYDAASGAPYLKSWQMNGTTLHNIKLRMFVNGKEVLPDPKHALLSYAFADLDHLLLTDATDDAQLQSELSRMTDDACLYSQTCPERGKPPAENCIADPEVPCSI